MRWGLWEVIRSRGGPHMMGSMSLQKRLFPPWRVQREVGSLQPGRGLLPEPSHAGTLVSDFRLLELWEINLVFISNPVCGTVTGALMGSDRDLWL